MAVGIGRGAKNAGASGKRPLGATRSRFHVLSVCSKVDSSPEGSDRFCR